MKKVSVSPKRFTNMAKRITKLRPASAAAKRLSGLMEMELMKLLVTGGKRAAEKAVKGVKVGAHKLEVAERNGSLTRWRNRIGTGMQALEIALLATAAMKGASVKVGKAPRLAPAKRTGRKQRTRK
jgi:hypothetical protein